MKPSLKDNLQRQKKVSSIVLAVENVGVKVNITHKNVNNIKDDHHSEKVAHGQTYN